MSAVLIAQACANVAPTASPTASPTMAPTGTPAAMACLRGEYRALPLKDIPVSAQALDIIVVIIGNRLADFGLAQSQFAVEAKGADRVLVQFAAVADEQALRQLIASTGRLEFVGVPPDRSDEVEEGLPIPVDLPVILTGAQVAQASPGFTSTGQRAVDLSFTAAGAQQFDEYAAAHLGEQFAIVVDGVAFMAPIIQSTHFDGKAQISGPLTTQAEAARLVTLINFGALPNPLEEVSFSFSSC
jgi:preprotein translocase subunit SecD